MVASTDVGHGPSFESTRNATGTLAHLAHSHTSLPPLRRYTTRQTFESQRWQRGSARSGHEKTESLSGKMSAATTYFPSPRSAAAAASPSAFSFARWSSSTFSASR